MDFGSQSDLTVGHHVKPDISADTPVIACGHNPCQLQVTTLAALFNHTALHRLYNILKNLLASLIFINLKNETLQ